MANSFGAQVIVLDTFTGNIDVMADGKYPGSNLDVASVEWVAPTTVAHTAIVKNGTSAFFKRTCAVANDGGGPVYYPEGFTVPNVTITAGEVQSGVIIIVLR